MKKKCMVCENIVYKSSDTKSYCWAKRTIISTHQLGYRKCDTHARVLSEIVSHAVGTAIIKIRHRNREKKVRRNEWIRKEEQRTGNGFPDGLQSPGDRYSSKKWMNYLTNLTSYNSSTAPWDGNVQHLICSLFNSFNINRIVLLLLLTLYLKSTRS